MNETTIVELTSDPELVEEADRVVVSAEGETIPHRTPVRVTLLPRGPGVYHPWRRGDRLACIVMQGRAVGGVYPVGWYGDIDPPQATANTEIRARAGGDLVVAPSREGGDVLLGRETREGAVYQRVMLYDRASGEIATLKSVVNSIIDEVGALMGPAGPNWAAARRLQTSLIVGGDPSDGAKASLEPLGGGQG